MAEQEKKLFDEQRFQERIGVIIRNIRNVASTNCIGVDLSKLSDQILTTAIAPVLIAYDSELGDMWDQYLDAMAQKGICNG